MKTVVGVAIICLLVISCGPSKKGIFSDRRSDHQKYGDRIKDAGLHQTTMGGQWFAAADKSLLQPVNISLPYKESGYFAAEKPSASGYKFSVRRGDRISLNISVVPDTTTNFFGELWRPGATVAESDMIASIDSTRKIVHDVEEDGIYQVRLQPALLESVEFTLTITTQPTLAFPVSDSGNPRLISFWSDPRDGGRRSHEGVDISAKFRTPAIASANGTVSRVMENRLGGKVVFMRPEGKNYSLYYAHLDTQTVITGQKVVAGQTLGLVGNTGNAKGTVPHLHFGIYGWGGAIDPLPFIDPRRKDPPEIAASLRPGQWMRTSTNTRLVQLSNDSGTLATDLSRGTPLYIRGATDRYVRVELPDGLEGFVNYRAVTDDPLNTENIEAESRLLDRPLADAPAITTIGNKEKVEVIGTFGSFDLVRSGGSLGWIMK